MGFYKSYLSVGCSVMMLIAVVGIMIFSAIATYVGNYSNPHWETITVTDKNINPGEKREKWLIYTEEEVYCITDLFFVGFFESSDVYNSIKPGNTYRVYVSGNRYTIISAYKVIRKVEPYEQ